MRKLLKTQTKAHYGRQTYTADFSEIGVRGAQGVVNPTICVKNVRDADGNFIASHMWFNYSNDFRKLGELREGDSLSFTAQPSAYQKGHGFSKTDYKLVKPGSIELLTKRPIIPLPMNKNLLIGYICIKRHMYLSKEHELNKQKYMDWAKNKYLELKAMYA